MDNIRSIISLISAVPIFILLWQATSNASARNLEAAIVAMLCSLIFLLYLRIATGGAHG